MLELFKSVLEKVENHNTYILLGEAGFVELFPAETHTTWKHPDYPNQLIRRYNDKSIRLIDIS